MILIRYMQLLLKFFYFSLQFTILISLLVKIFHKYYLGHLLIWL